MSPQVLWEKTLCVVVSYPVASRQAVPVETSEGPCDDAFGKSIVSLSLFCFIVYGQHLSQKACTDLLACLITMQLRRILKSIIAKLHAP